MIDQQGVVQSPATKGGSIMSLASDYLSMTKPPIIILLVITAVGAMFLAAGGPPPAPHGRCARGMYYPSPPCRRFTWATAWPPWYWDYSCSMPCIWGSVVRTDQGE